MRPGETVVALPCAHPPLVRLILGDAQAVGPRAGSLPATLERYPRAAQRNLCAGRQRANASRELVVREHPGVLTYGDLREEHR
jgi:hypothetical protein